MKKPRDVPDLSGMEILIVGEWHLFGDFVDAMDARKLFNTFAEYGRFSHKQMDLLRKSLVTYYLTLARLIDWHVHIYNRFGPDALFSEVTVIRQRIKGRPVSSHSVTVALLRGLRGSIGSGMPTFTPYEERMAKEDPPYYTALNSLRDSAKSFFGGPFLKFRDFQSAKTAKLYGFEITPELDAWADLDARGIRKKREVLPWEIAAFEDMVNTLNALKQKRTKRVIISVGAGHASIFCRMFKDAGIRVSCCRASEGLVYKFKRSKTVFLLPIIDTLKALPEAELEALLLSLKGSIPSKLLRCVEDALTEGL